MICSRIKDEASFVFLISILLWSFKAVIGKVEQKESYYILWDTRIIQKITVNYLQYVNYWSTILFIIAPVRVVSFSVTNL